MSKNNVCQSLYTYVRLQVSVERTKNIQFYSQALSYNSIMHAIISNILLSKDCDVRKYIHTTTGVTESH